MQIDTQVHNFISTYPSVIELGMQWNFCEFKPFYVCIGDQKLFV